MLYTIIGGKVADIEKKTSSNGKSWGFLRVAETSDFKNKDGEKITSFYSIPIFGEGLIDLINNGVDKGGKLLITGQADLPKSADGKGITFDSKMCNVKILDFKKKDKVEKDDEDSSEFPF